MFAPTLTGRVLRMENVSPTPMGSRSKDPGSPSVQVLKRLFAVARNRCAFPGCISEIVDESGEIIGEVCHIAGRINGPRYDPGQTNLARHGFDNLIVLCGAHHKIVDQQVSEYTVERLSEIKRNNERAAGDAGIPEMIIKKLFERLKIEFADAGATLENRRGLPANRMVVSLLRVIRRSTHGRSEEFLRYSFLNQTAEPIPIPIWSIKWTDSRALDIAQIWEHGFGRPHGQEYHHEADVRELEITPNTTVSHGETGIIELLLSQKSLIEPLGHPASAWSFTDYLLPTDIAHKADVYVIFPCEGLISASPHCDSCSQIAHWECMTGRELLKLTALMQIGSPTTSVNTTLLSQLSRYFDMLR